MRMRTVAIVLASVPTLLAQPDRSVVEIYRQAVAAYLESGDAATSARPLASLRPDQLEPAVKAVLTRADPRELESAADLQLEIGITVAGLSVSGTGAYFDQGSRLVTAILPPPAISKGLSAVRMEEIALISSIWHRVAASTFLSINDLTGARRLIQRAGRVASESAAVFTLVGTAHEIDAGLNDLDHWDPASAKPGGTMMRASLLLRAEEAYRSALESDPGYVLAVIRLGRVQSLQKNAKAARESLERGATLAREPRHLFLAAMFMGALQESQNDLTGARQSYERALSIVPQSQDAVAALAFAELVSGRINRAEKVARDYTSARRDDAWWLHKTGAFDFEGLQWLRQHLRQ